MFRRKRNKEADEADEAAAAAALEEEEMMMLAAAESRPKRFSRYHFVGLLFAAAAFIMFVRADNYAMAAVFISLAVIYFGVGSRENKGK